MREAGIRDRAQQLSFDDADTGSVFELKHDVEAIETADHLTAEIIAYAEAKFAETLKDPDGGEVVEMAKDQLNTWINRD